MATLPLEGLRPSSRSRRIRLSVVFPVPFQPNIKLNLANCGSSSGHAKSRKILQLRRLGKLLIVIVALLMNWCSHLCAG